MRDNSWIRDDIPFVLLFLIRSYINWLSFMFSSHYKHVIKKCLLFLLLGRAHALTFLGCYILSPYFKEIIEKLLEMLLARKLKSVVY